MESKVCGKCKISLSLSSFSKRKNSKDGFQSQCKKCQFEYKQKWIKDNPEYHSSKNKKWQQNNLNKFKLYSKKWRDNNKDKIRKYNRSYYKKKYYFYRQYSVCSKGRMKYSSSPRCNRN